MRSQTRQQFAKQSAYFVQIIVSFFIWAFPAVGHADSLLWGADNGTYQDNIITIDPLTGVTATVGPVSFTNIRGLAYDPSSDTLYGVDSGQLITIDQATGAGSVVGAMGYHGFEGLTYDSSSNVLYGVTATSFTNSLFTIDRTTGAASLIGPIGEQYVSGLAYDSWNDTLYGINIFYSSSELIAIDRTTGLGTVVAQVDHGQLRGLAYDASSDILYAASAQTAHLITIDRSSGNTSSVAPLPYSAVTGLTVIPTASTQYSCQGFFEPFSDPLSIKRRAKGTIPVKMNLQDGLYQNVGISDLAAAPVINVTFNGMVYGDEGSDDVALEPNGMSNDGNIFDFNDAEQQWEFGLGTKQFPAPGTYSVTVRSGDESEYKISPGCSQIFTRQN